MTSMHVPALLLLFFASGFAGLVYQVLWQRQLGLLFGSTAHASATTLAIFFLGLALGSRIWGRRAARTARPLSAYAALEIGIAASAAAYFVLYDLYIALLPWLTRALGGAPLLLAAAKALLATGVLLPPAVLMGGTLPMMAQHLVRSAAQLGRTGTLLYAVNTAGGAAGAFAAGFYLPALLGFTRSYLLAIGLSAAVAALAHLLGRLPSAAQPPAVSPAADAARGAATPAIEPAIRFLAFLSGFCTLGLEVLWTLMFAQVLHNSVYSFAIILCTFLIALALGSAVAHLLCRTARRPEIVLFASLLLAGASACLVPFAFHAVTGGLAYVAPEAGWHAYLRAVFGTAAAVMLAPGVAIGIVFPFLLAVVRAHDASPGRTIGTLAAVNTLGAVLGSLAAGFVLIEWLGLWASIKTLGLLYFAAAAITAPRDGLPSAARALPLVGLLLFATILDPTRLSVVRTDPRGGEAVTEYWQSAYGVTAVVQRGKRLTLKMDNYYALGGTGALTYEQTQADIPLVIHPAPRSVFFLGLGTGITAGAALLHPIERLTAVELVPEVIEASRKHFKPYINDLFDDPRAEILAGDGRAFLRASDARHDVIVSDLFIPWQAGAGTLYTREHFATVRSRLEPGGLFAQWLPLYQLSRDEFMVIARTMLEVFPQVTLWRGDFQPKQPIVALVGEAAERPLDGEAVVASFRRRRRDADAPRAAALALTLMFYGGNLGANRDLFAPYLLNTDDRPVIEFSAPITQREERGRGASWFAGRPLSEWYEQLAERLPPERDPYLADLGESERGYARAGWSLFESKVRRADGDEAGAVAMAEEFGRQVPAEVQRMFAEALR
jgi:spermidine synthase